MLTSRALSSLSQKPLLIAYCRCRSLASAADPVSSEYVHPLSQIVLEHLQSTRQEWIKSQGLDRGLTIQRDGTFELKFPTSNGRIWYGNLLFAYLAWLIVCVDPLTYCMCVCHHVVHRTSYDTEEKKHWLTVHKGDLVGRYLLQDNLKPAWHDDTRSTPEKITDAVDTMIETIQD